MQVSRSVSKSIVNPLGLMVTLSTPIALRASSSACLALVAKSCRSRAGLNLEYDEFSEAIFASGDVLDRIPWHQLICDAGIPNTVAADEEDRAGRGQQCPEEFKGRNAKEGDAHIGDQDLAGTKAIDALVGYTSCSR
jgi:hypothetical protein